MITLANRFAAEWHDLAVALELPKTLEATILAELFAGYNGADRQYHNIRHIVSMLTAAAELDFQDRHAARLAIVFHDLVYDPVRNDNEKCSAGRMRELLTDHVDDLRLDRAAAMILATARHAATGDSDTDLVLDLDMAILGQPWPVYEAYALGVKAEYSPYLDDATWRQGRAALFIIPTLAKERIFLTGTFRLLEVQARDNLRREQAWLSGGA